VTTWFKHQPFANPIKFVQEVLALFIHRVSLKLRAAFPYQPYRIAACVRINADESLLMGHD
jgi:hypothetical protein